MCFNHYRNYTVQEYSQHEEPPTKVMVDHQHELLVSRPHCNLQTSSLLRNTNVEPSSSIAPVVPMFRKRPVLGAYGVNGSIYR
jgi:hypothetical protein